MLSAAEQKTLHVIQAKIDAAKLRGIAAELDPKEEKFLDAMAIKRSRAALRTKGLSGKSLSAREERILSGSESIDGVSESGEFAKNLTVLARVIGRTPRCLNKWREKYPDAPKPRSDGRISIPETRAWMDKHNLTAAPDQDEDSEDTKAYWDRQRSRLDFERGAFGFEVEKQKFLRTDEIEAAVGQMLAGFRTAMNSLPSSAARWLVGLKDFHAIKDKLQAEVDAVLQALGRSDYLEHITPATVAKLFPELDEKKRGDLVALCDQVFAEIGRQTLSDLLQRALPTIADTAVSATSAKPQSRRKKK